MWSKIKLMLSGVWSWFEPSLKDFASKTGQLVLQSASQAVIATAKYALDNDEAKRKMAYGLIVSDLKSKGIQVGVDVATSVINRGIELAVGKEKSAGTI